MSHTLMQYHENEALRFEIRIDGLAWQVDRHPERACLRRVRQRTPYILNPKPQTPNPQPQIR